MNDLLRKAAVLISAIDAKTADALLDQMTPQQAARVRAAVMDLDDVSAEEQQQVLREFAQSQRPVATASTDGVELDESLLRRLTAPETLQLASPATQPVAAELAVNDHFRWLAQIPLALLSRRLCSERAQVIAVVVAHLPPARAAEFLGQLPNLLQAEVAQCLIYRDAADPVMELEMEQALRVQLADELHDEQRRIRGMATLETIVAAAAPEQREGLIHRLAHRDHDLARRFLAFHNDEVNLGKRATDEGPVSMDDTHQVCSTRTATSAGHLPSNGENDAFNDRVFGQGLSPKMSAGGMSASVVPEEFLAAPPLPFELLADLDDRSLTIVLRAVDAEIVLLALAGASPELMRRVERRLPNREARTLRRRIEHIGPVRLRDIEEAQKRIEAIAGSLVSQGTIPPPPKSLAVA